MARRSPGIPGGDQGREPAPAARRSHERAGRTARRSRAACWCEDPGSAQPGRRCRGARASPCGCRRRGSSPPSSPCARAQAALLPGGLLDVGAGLVDGGAELVEVGGHGSSGGVPGERRRPQEASAPCLLSVRKHPLRLLDQALNPSESPCDGCAVGTQGAAERRKRPSGPDLARPGALGGARPPPSARGVLPNPAKPEDGPPLGRGDRLNAEALPTLDDGHVLEGRRVLEGLQGDDLLEALDPLDRHLVPARVVRIALGVLVLVAAHELRRVGVPLHDAREPHDPGDLSRW